MTFFDRAAKLRVGKLRTLLTCMVIIFTCFLLSNCDNTPPPKTPVEEGRELAKLKCISCHSYPEPGLLDRESWTKHVLPAMAPRLGIKVYAEDMYVNVPNSNGAVTYDEWSKIVAFYTAMSPVKLKPAKHPVKPLNDWAFFSLVKPVKDASVSTTTLVSFDTISKHFYTSDMINNTLYQWSDKLAKQKAVKFGSAAVDAKFSKDAAGNPHGAFTFIGSLDAVDSKSGVLADIDLKNISNPAFAKNMALDLNRAVQSVSADFNKDGLPDWVVCQFGHNFGDLSLFTQGKGGVFAKKSIRNITGPTNVVTGDYNNDGWPDVMCLFAQGDEGVWLFLNDKKGGFTTKNLLHFPPMYGSTSFQLVDFNHDGKLDILYTCGDNSDYSRVLKPFHGVYIFLNEGNDKYKQAYFYPINGATKAVATDFNGDGKLDIAVIAFFSDLKDNPAEGFTYLEQTSPLKFTANNIPVDKAGRWICMDVKDYNGDGKPDIILGNFSIGFINEPGVKKDWDPNTPFVVLQNNRK